MHLLTNTLLEDPRQTDRELVEYYAKVADPVRILDSGSREYNMRQ
jgi:hypothetical protein